MCLTSDWYIQQSVYQCNMPALVQYVNANTQHAGMQYVSMQYAGMQYVNANMQYAGMQYVNMQYVNMQYVNANMYAGMQ